MIPSTGGPLTRLERGALALGMLLAVGLMWPLRGYLTDDTFIHLQYARHLSLGHGLVFNPGERVYGCTSPLWATLIADGMALHLDGLKVARATYSAGTPSSHAHGTSRCAIMLRGHSRRPPNSSDATSSAASAPSVAPTIRIWRHRFAA